MSRPLALAFAATFSLLTSCSPPAAHDPLLEKAEGGDPEAQFLWAERAIEGGDLEEAAEWLQQSKDSGYRPALRLSAIRTLESVHASEAEASASLRALQELARQDDLESILYLASLAERGTGVPYEPGAALEYYRQAAALGDGYARYKVLLEQWMREGDSLDADAVVALQREVYDIATQHDPRAFSLYARVLDRQGRTADADKRHLEAAQAGEPYSLYRVGIAYHRRVRDPAYGPLGFDFLLQAEQSGVSEALYPLAKAYFSGNGISIDKNKALRLSRLAAWLGDPEAIEFAITREVRDRSDWDLETKVEFAALAQLHPIDNAAITQHLNLRLGGSGLVFQQLAQSRVRERQADIEAYRRSRRSGRPETVASDQALPPRDALAPYGDKAGLVRDALDTRDGAALHQLALHFLNPDSPQSDDAEGLRWLQDAAALGNAEARVALYERFLDDPSASPLPQEQVLLALQAAHADGHPDASFYLALERWSGNHLPRNPQLAARTAEAAHEQGHPEAIALIKEILSSGEPVTADSPLLLSLTEALADAGNADARFLLAGKRLHRYLIDRLDERRGERRPPRSLRSLNRDRLPFASALSSSYHSLRSFNSLGDYATLFNPTAFVYQNEETLDPEVKTALADIWTLADEGHPQATRTAIMWLLRGYFVEADAEKAAELYQQADPKVLTAEMTAELAEAYLLGISADYNLSRAALLLRQAAQAGNRGAASLFHDLDDSPANDDPSQPDHESTLVDLAYRSVALKDARAMCLLALALDQNEYFTKEYSKNEYMKWISESAKLGHLDAYIVIGSNYLSGEYVEKNPRRGLRYLEQAADLGSAEAQYLYGNFLATGAEIERDFPQAMRYLQLAAEQQHVKARRLLANLQQTNPKADLATAEETEVLGQIVAGIRGHDLFPTVPHLVHDGELLPVSSAARGRPSYESNEASGRGQRQQEAALLAGDSFHPSRITVEKAVLMAPVIFHEGAIVFTGREPSLTLDLASDTEIEAGYALLLLKQGRRAADYHWAPLPKLSPGTSRRLRFTYDNSFVTPSDIAVYFFAEGREIPSNARIQPQPFLDATLSRFQDRREQYLAENTAATRDAALTSPFRSFLDGVIYLPLNAAATFEVNELGYAKSVTLPDGLRDDATLQIHRVLPFLTFYPSLRDGKPAPGAVTESLE